MNKMNIETVAARTAVEPNAMYLSMADRIYDNTEDVSRFSFLKMRS
jgi:hypothetical protein